jgi:hypothetical protein
MAIARSTAERLSTAAELQLVEASYPATAKQLTPGRLRQKIQRARKLRDKYRDLSKRQRLEARGKRDASGTRPAKGNANTERKAELFQEVLERFERWEGEEGKKGEGRKREGAAKPGARKSAAKKARTKQAAKKQAGVKKAGVKKAGVGRAPAEGRAQPAAPGRPGASAMKGARQRPDSSQAAQGRNSRSHTRSATNRAQTRRDSRG